MTLDHEPRGLVYYIADPLTVCVKIGTTIALAQRFRTIRRNHPGVTLLAAEPGYIDLEHARHRQFAALRVEERRETEWFQRKAPLTDHIDAVHRTHGDPWKLVGLECAPRLPKRDSLRFGLNEKHVIAAWTAAWLDDEAGTSRRSRRSLTVRLAETGYGRIADRADRADVDVSRMVRRMLAYADRHMPEGWVPSSRPTEWLRSGAEDRS